MVLEIALGVFLAKLAWEAITMLIATVIVINKKVRTHQRLREEARKIKEKDGNRSTN